MVLSQGLICTLWDSGEVACIEGCCPHVMQEWPLRGVPLYCAANTQFMEFAIILWGLHIRT